jgi:segregation and condensation protein A
MDYKVKFEVFEGPLDLLLYLIKKEEVDIYQVNLTKLATQFIEYIDMMRMLDLEIAGEFLVMASTLMYIKSRELLPVDQQVAAEEEEEGEDPRWELIRQLGEYKKFKDAAAQLQELEVRQERVVHLVEHHRRIEPRAEAIGECGLPDAERPFDGDVTKVDHGPRRSIGHRRNSGQYATHDDIRAGLWQYLERCESSVCGSA